MVNELLRVRRERKEWFIDPRLRQARNVRKPHDYRNFDTVEALMEWAQTKKKATIDLHVGDRFVAPSGWIAEVMRFPVNDRGISDEVTLLFSRSGECAVKLSYIVRMLEHGWRKENK
jgi:hypothetical protein